MNVMCIVDKEDHTKTSAKRCNFI